MKLTRATLYPSLSCSTSAVLTLHHDPPHFGAAVIGLGPMWAHATPEMIRAALLANAQTHANLHADLQGCPRITVEWLDSEEK
jgi:hypothetical protein